MEINEVLLTIAEVSVALAGFGGIAAGLGYRSRGRWNDQDRFRLLAMVSVSLGIVFACLVPFTLQSIGIQDYWLVAGGLVLLIPISSQIIQFRLFRHGLPSGFSMSTTLSILVSNVGGLSFLGLLLARVPGKDTEQGFYLAAITFLLLSPAILFLRLIKTSFIAKIDGEES